MRLINADALKRKAQKEATEAWKMNIKAPVETILNQFIDWIDDATTVDVTDTNDGETISRQAAIDAIEGYSDRLQMVNWKENPGVPYKVHALNWCVNTIRELPHAQPVNYGSTNLIDEKDVLDAIHKVIFSVIDTKSPLTVIDKQLLSINKAITTKIKELPSAQRNGKWIYPTDIKGFGRCPHCKALWDYSLISNPFFKFCPRCGNGENELTELKGEEDVRESD